MTPIGQKVVSLLADPRLSYSEISREVGLCRERVRQIAEQVGPTFQKRIKLRRQEKLDRVAETIPAEETPMGFVWREAVSAGLQVERIVVDYHDYELRPLANRLSINGKLCVVSAAFVTITTKEGGRGYSKHNITECGADFQLTVRMIANFPWVIHVLPVKTLRKHFARGFYIPLVWKPIYKNLPPTLDWREYENAWEQLR